MVPLGVCCYRMTSIGDAVDSLRRPEYTGANRCLPCTVVNACIAVGAAVVLGALLFPWVGLFALAVFAGLIYLRGYLVPGTPTLTKRYLPARALALFGKDAPVEATVLEPSTAVTAADADTGSDSEPAFDTADPLVAAGVLQRDGGDEREGDPALTPTFRDAWRERTDGLLDREVDAEDVRAAFAADDASAVGDLSFVLDGNRSVRWGSEAALAADVAAAVLLGERLSDWADREGTRQRTLLTGLRFCLDRCPVCDGAVAVSQDRVEPCCEKPHLVAESVCEDCGAHIADAAVVAQDGSAGEDGEGSEGDERRSMRARLLEPGATAR